MKLRASLPFDCEVCILAGGLSTRMGCDKARLRLDHRTMLRWVRAATRQLKLPVRVIRRDLKPGCGPLGGIYTALKSSHADTVLFLACDMPFISTGLLHAVFGNLTPGPRAWFVRHGGRVGFPFLLRRDALPIVIDQVAQKELSLQTLARILKARTIRLPRAMSAELFNINTPADWKKARRRVAELRS
jgi:molybdopterin-guanine dinucleotide biosynthesis protein A